MGGTGKDRMRYNLDFCCSGVCCGYQSDFWITRLRGSEVYCVKCGCKLLPDARFCTSCGKVAVNAAQVAPSSKGSTGGTSVHGITAGSEDDIYALIAEELKSGNTDPGLWTRLFAECDGDESKTKVAYIRTRVEKIKALAQARIQEEAQNQEELERAAAEERVRRAAEADDGLRRKLVADGQLEYASLDDCLELIQKAGYSAERIGQQWVVRSTGNPDLPIEIKDLPELRSYVEKVTFLRATKEDCIAEFKKLGCGVMLKSNGLTSVTLPNGERRVLEGVGEFRKLANKLHAGTLK